MNAVLYSVWAAMFVILIAIEASRRELRKRLERIEEKIESRC
jgi:hypothetical protein